MNIRENGGSTSPEYHDENFECPKTGSGQTKKEKWTKPTAVLAQVIAADGFTYERGTIQLWWRRNGQLSPMSGTRLPTRNLLPNRALRQLIGAIYPHGSLGTPPNYLEVRRCIPPHQNITNVPSAASFQEQLYGTVQYGTRSERAISAVE